MPIAPKRQLIGIITCLRRTYRACLICHNENRLCDEPIIGRQLIMYIGCLYLAATAVVLIDEIEELIGYAHSHIVLI